MVDEGIIEGLREYLKDHYIPEDQFFAALAVDAEIAFDEQADFSDINEDLLAESCELTVYEEPAAYSFRNLSDDASGYIKKHRKPGGFAHALEGKRVEKGLSPAELYKKANVDRRLYSRLMGPEGRNPSMNTALSFALALKLKRRELEELLQTAGYALSNSSTRDVCIMYCLEKSIYNIDDVNALLFSIGIEPLSRDVGE